ncbi:unnamed protein product [Spirodela intermedia]|uniref:Uncharacterized protein n=1 Tax=Spirodela intermedia TaxID=51605 RepID=A0A7I8KI65_SPIIN|nr:unnamed protein product [Spirodela intermedia]
MGLILSCLSAIDKVSPSKTDQGKKHAVETLKGKKKEKKPRETAALVVANFPHHCRPGLL